MTNAQRASMLFAACILLFSQAALAQPSALPHLEKRGEATQLVVDGKPYLILGGEIANTASTSLEYMETVWPRLKEMNLNTALVAVPWAMVEPREGAFDWKVVDGLLDGARKQDMRVVFLWFGSWKNGISSFVPGWVKSDQKRFPRMQVKGGRSVEVLSALSAENLKADTKAYVEFMRHLKAVDGDRHTVVMIQMQNEVGLLGDSRDRGPEAGKAFAADVPKELTAYMAKHRETLNPDLRLRWEAAGAKSSGSWEALFGVGTATDELFMAWTYARYMNAMTEAGKKEFALPVFTNTWIVQPEDKGPGDYPGGGPQPHNMDVWKAGAPSIDFNAPDVYLPDFEDFAKAFKRADNPLFVPESRGDEAGVANAFIAIGGYDSIGYSPFGIDNTGRLVTLRPADGQQGPAELANLPLPRAYKLLAAMAPAILEGQSAGKIGAAAVSPQTPDRTIRVGAYDIHVAILRNRRDPSQMQPLGYALVIEKAPGEYYVAGTSVQVTFTPATPGPAIAGIAEAEQGTFDAGQWIPGRMMSGDDILLDYKLAEAAARNQSGSGLKFPPDGPLVQRVKLYRYE